MIDAVGLAKVFPAKKGEVTAVDHIDFKCDAGEVYGLLGPNGAGKTTTLRMLSTALQPTAGSAVVNGYDVVKHPQRVRESVGFLSGDTGLYRRLTAREMIVYFGRLYGMERAALQRRVDELMDMMEIRDFADRRCDKLSSGQKQRVSICRSIVHDPPVMIFDEPAEGLDIIAAETIMNFIKSCRERGKCVIFSTHIMREAETVCDRIGIINRGRIAVEGALSELKRRFETSDLETVFRRAVKSE